MPLADRIRLQHLLDAARTILASVSERSRSDLELDQVWSWGVVKGVEIIGKAAANVTTETRDRHPQIPWTQIVAMKNRLVHVHFTIDMEQLWKTVGNDLPVLIGELEKILKE